MRRKRPTGSRPCHGLPLLLLAGALSCGESATTPGSTATDIPRPSARYVTATVLLDGQPAADTEVRQGGATRSFFTDDAGRVTVEVDESVQGEWVLMASHPEARIGAAPISDEDALTLALTRFLPEDNPAYLFQDPGLPGGPDTTAQCSHCHESLRDDWFASPHRSAASNPRVHDLYAGAAAALVSQAACEQAGGQWRLGLGPGTGAPAERCYLGAGVLPTLNPGCDAEGACDAVATQFGGCADCHAPGIDGVLGGRSLLEATGIAYDAGVHCDTCHRTESVDLEAPPGVAGRLRFVRPSEPSTSAALGPWKPLTFGPYPDVANVRMGSVARDLFHGATLCAGCHESQQAVLVPGASADPARWPAGKLPIHSTYSEWLAGPFSPGVPCPSCHMPPDPSLWNAADLQLFAAAGAGVVTGWPRPPGSVRSHGFLGPRQRTSGLLELAASLTVEKSVTNGELTALVSVKNVGPGHALPTGEPSRRMVLLVEARCGAQPLRATGGDAIPDFGGALERREAKDGFSDWPGARVGEVLRVVRRPGPFRDYEGFGPFGDGTFSPAEKGMPVEEVVGESTILAMNGDTPVLDAPLPEGDVVYRGEGGAFPSEGQSVSARAGAPGFAFGRILVGPDGAREVPHFLAVDVASDNRLLPQRAFTTQHHFATPCPDPEVHAVLVYRAQPLGLARERGWKNLEAVMAEVTR